MKQALYCKTIAAITVLTQKGLGRLHFTLAHNFLRLLFRHVTNITIMNGQQVRQYKLWMYYVSY
jgi:hypothetical protein